jgi:uncharacterized repeat protein (TIGR01451 family)
MDVERGIKIADSHLDGRKPGHGERIAMNVLTQRWARTILTTLVMLAGAGSATAYDYGIMPTGASPADASLSTRYDNYKTNYFTSDCGSVTVTRVRFARSGQPNADQTVSEGMGYGMLMAAYLESEAAGATIVRNLMNFVKAKYASPTLLMDWKVTCSGVVGTGPASDGDLDIAMALLQAHKRWPTAGFKADADILIQRILIYETDSCGLRPGNWGGCGDTSNPSYYAMSYFTSFGCAGYSGWDTVKTASYSRLDYWRTNYALPPDWIVTNTGAVSGTDQYYYDACRTPWRLSLDYLWYGNSAAQTLCNKVVNNFKTTDPNPATMGDRYTASTGAKTGSNHSPAFVGPAACGAMVSSAHQTWLDNAYNNLKGLAATAYYPDSLQVISLMVLTGVFTDPSCTTGPSPTPTNTHSPTPTGTPGANLSISKSCLSNPLHPGETFSYRIAVVNVGTGAASGVTVRDTLPTQVTYLSSAPAGTFSSPAYQWNFASLGVGASAVITVGCVVGASVPVSSVISNSADVFGVDFTSKRSSTNSVSVLGWATTITKSASTASVAVGETFTYTVVYGNTSTGADYSQATAGVTLTMHNNNNAPTGDATITTYFRIANNSGGSINLANYRITYWWVMAGHTAGEYSTAVDYASAGAVTTARLDVSPSGTGYDKRLVVGWSSGSLANTGSVDVQLRTYPTGYAFNETETDDYSFPGQSGTYAVNTKVVLEEYKGGVWVYVSGTPPAGGGRTLSAVTITDRLATGLTYVGTLGTPTGTYNTGTRVVTWAVGSLSPGGRNTLTLLAAGLTAGTATVNTATMDCAEDGPNTSNPVTVLVSGTGPTFTFTPTRTVTPTFTVGNTYTFTPTRTMTPTYTVANTYTFTPTRTVTPTFTTAYTNTFTATRTATRTFTPTPTLPPGTTVVETPTYSYTPTPTDSFTPSYTPTHTPPPGPSPDTPTPTYTFTSTFSMTFTYTFTPTPTFTFTETPTEATATAVPTGATPFGTPTRTPIAPPGGGITVSDPYPNPPKDGGTVYIEVVGGDGSSLRWTVYSTALRKIREGSLRTQGRTVLAWDLKDQKGKPVANGIYHVVLRPQEGEPPILRKVIVLR